MCSANWSTRFSQGENKNCLKPEAKSENRQQMNVLLFLKINNKNVNFQFDLVWYFL